MSSVVSRSVPRLVTTLRTTPALCPHAQTSVTSRTNSQVITNTRTITSFQGLQGQTQPWLVARPDIEQTGEPMQNHLDAMSFWYGESKKLSQSRVVPPQLVADNDLESLSREQAVDLLEHLVEEGVLDVRQGWIGSDY